MRADAALRFGRAPGAWPFLGHAVALLRRPLPLLDSLPAHGDLVEIRLGPRPAFVLCHPDLARRVLTDFRGFDRAGRGYERVRAAMGNGLATVAQPDHRRQRLKLKARRQSMDRTALASPAISAGAVKGAPSRSSRGQGRPPCPRLFLGLSPATQ